MKQRFLFSNHSANDAATTSQRDRILLSGSSSVSSKSESKKQKRLESPKWKKPALLVVTLFLVISIWLIKKTFETGNTSTNNAAPLDSITIPALSQLSLRQRRITLVAVWSGDVYKEHMLHLIQSAKENKDTVDLVFINRLTSPDQTCIDFPSHGIHFSGSDNIRIVCMTNSEWVKRHVNFLCSGEHGWDCDSEERNMVAQHLASRPDRLNCDWKPFRGWIFNDLFPQPDYPFWAWIDVDISLGRFSNYPFNLLSTLSFATGFYTSPTWLFMAGQFTAFNMDDPYISSAWKMLPTLKSPEHFALSLDGPHPALAGDEGYWSHAYMKSGKGWPGEYFSWASLPDLHGQDVFSNDRVSYIVSGSDTLQIEGIYSREELEAIVAYTRFEKGNDGRKYIDWNNGIPLYNALSSPTTNASLFLHSDDTNTKSHVEATLLLEEIDMRNGDECVHKWLPMRYTQCTESHPLTISSPPILRASFLRRRGSPPDRVWRKLDLDDKRRGFSTKLFMHYQYLKRNNWFEFPPFAIDENHIMHVQQDGVQVFAIGSRRAVTLFERRRRRPQIEQVELAH